MSSLLLNNYLFHFFITEHKILQQKLTNIQRIDAVNVDTSVSFDACRHVLSCEVSLM